MSVNSRPAKPDIDRIRIEETIKWSIPYFEHNGLVGGMAAFKAHVGLGFWKAKLLSDPKGLFGEAVEWIEEGKPRHWKYMKKK